MYRKCGTGGGGVRFPPSHPSSASRDGAVIEVGGTKSERDGHRSVTSRTEASSRALPPTGHRRRPRSRALRHKWSVTRVLCVSVPSSSPDIASKRRCRSPRLRASVVAKEKTACARCSPNFKECSNRGRRHFFLLVSVAAGSTRL